MCRRSEKKPYPLICVRIIHISTHSRVTGIWENSFEQRFLKIVPEGRQHRVDLSNLA